MKLRLATIGACALLAAAAGCSSRRLQSDAGGGGGFGSIDAGKDALTTTESDGADDRLVAVDLGTRDLAAGDPPPEAALDGPPPFTGVRSFVVTSQLQRDGGTGVIPTSHVFTMVLDADRRLAITGGAGEGTASTFEILAGGVMHIIGSPRFATDGCPGSSVGYDDLRFTIDPTGGLTGAGRGQVLVVGGDTAATFPVTMSLTGVADTQPPTLLLRAGGSDPLSSYTVASSEPLPTVGMPVLRAASGETIALSGDATTGGFVTTFHGPATILHYATQYRVATDGIVDFAGNTAIAGNDVTFTTRAAPPLAAEDGFESVTATTFGGVQVLSGAGAPTLTGVRSLYIPPTSGGPTAATQPQFLVRLALAAGDTAVRFSYRTVALSTGTAFLNGATWQLGSEGGTVASPMLPSDSGATTAATINGAQVSLGPLMTATFTLPPDAANEVVLQRTALSLTGPCGGPGAPPLTGIIIDDLRAE